MKAFLFVVITFSQFTFAKNILVLGDSHMANPLGEYLITHLSKLNYNVVILGHASSAPVDWLNKKPVYHKGGVFNSAYIQNKYYRNPNPKHWKEKVKVPYLEPLLDNMLYHDSWKKNKKRAPDIVIVELGANDANVIADKNGNRLSNDYDVRYNAAKKMSQLIKDRGAKCIWILPPNGESKPWKNQKVLHEMLIGAVKNNCSVFKKSQEFKASKSAALGCDGYHFNCNKREKRKAYNWSLEILKFLKETI